MIRNGADTLAAPVRMAAPTFSTVKERLLDSPTATDAKSRLCGETAIAGFVRPVPTAATELLLTRMADDCGLVLG